MKQTYRDINCEVNLLNEDGELQLERDHDAARQFFLEFVNPNTVFFHNLEEKTNYLVENNLWNKATVETFEFDKFKELFKRAYGKKFRFQSFMGAFKFYNQYALKTEDGDRFYERYEDRVVMCAIDLSGGDYSLARDLVDAIIGGYFQPATPTFLNAGRARGGERVSCFLIRVEDNMESIAKAIHSSLQLSKRGGGVGLNLTNLRELGSPIQDVPNISSGVIPVMKILEDSFSYANQLGQRQGAGAVYLNAHHPDIMRFLDTKRENADEKMRIKTLSLGVMIPDVTFELAKRNADMYLFSPYDVEKVEGKPFADLSVTENYQKWVEDDRIRKTKVNARQFFQTLSELQFESGYPYCLFEDTANRDHTMGHAGRVQQSNLCVAPETLVLTDTGYRKIKDIAGTVVNAWNGEKFSPSTVAKTGEGRRLLTIDFNNGASMDVTEQHKFYVKTGYGSCKVVEKQASELMPGDMLEKFDLPVVDDPEAPVFPHAYTAGLHTADGTYDKKGTALLRLYPGKTHLGEYIDCKSSSLKPDSTGRVSYTLPETVPDKYRVPINYSLQSRLEWLAGLIDGDGWGNGQAGIQIASIHPDFLEEVRLLLTTLGVGSKWSKLCDEGETVFKEGQKSYPTKRIYRLIISGSGAQKLRKLGLKTYRVQVEERAQNREATGYIKVESITDEGRIDDTYCLNEPEIHKVVFNGIRTGNCSEILQLQTPSEYAEDGSYLKVGADISCNLGSLNVKRMLDLDNDSFADVVDTAVRALTNVSLTTSMDSVPSVREGNKRSRAIGLGQMNLHGALAHHGIEYGGEQALQLLDSYMAKVTYHAMLASANLAKEYGEHAYFNGSEYQTGEWFTRKIAPWFEKQPNLTILGDLVAPTEKEWENLQLEISKHGMANAYLQAIPPTGSISYINHSTASIHPIVSPIEIRKEGKLGRVYYPAPHMTEDNIHLFKDAYQIGPEKLLDTYAVATYWVDQGSSCTLFFPATATTRDIDRARIYAWRKGIKTLYYIRIKQKAMSGTEVQTAADYC